MSDLLIGAIKVINAHEVHWKIRDFFSYKKVDECYISPDFHISGSTWNLQIYPNGRKENDSSGWISLYLFRNDCTVFPKGAIFKFGLKKANGTVKERLDARSWIFDNFNEGIGYGSFFDRFFLRPERNKSVLAPDDILTVTCNIEWASDNFKSILSLDTVSTQLYDLFSCQRPYDVKFKLKNETISTHRRILIARSPKFAHLFQQDRYADFFNLEGCETEAFEEFLNYMYSGTLGKISNTAFKVYEIAEICGVDELKTLCVLSIIAHLSEENVCDAAILGHYSGEYELKIKARDFFVDNFKEIVSTKKFISLMKDHTTLGNELLQNFADVKLE